MLRIMELQVNGTNHELQVEPERSLLSVLRDELELTGCKYGCGEGECGACTVLVDGTPRRSCRLKVGAVEGKEITTVEGLEQNGKLHPLQQAFLDLDAMQCAYCTSGMILSGVVLLLDDALAQESGRRGFGGRAPQDVSAWLHIGEDGVVTVYTGKVEVGQNARTALSQVVAEELRVPLASVRMVMGDTQLVPPDGGTVGSGTTPNMSPQLRRAAATAREMLVDLAAEQWKVERASLVAGDGKVTNKETKESSGYGKLTKGQKLTKTVSGEASLTPPDQ